MIRSSHLARRLLVAGLAASLVATSGCGWFRSSTGYETSRETRPLEVPPDMTAPVTDPTMQVPSVPRAPAGAQQPAAGGAVSSFELADEAGETWRRVGVALERIEGVTIVNRAQMLGSYELRYQGESFLLRVQGDGERSTVSSVNASGQTVSTGPATELMGLLRQRLS